MGHYDRIDAVVLGGRYAWPIAMQRSLKCPQMVSFSRRQGWQLTHRVGYSSVVVSAPWVVVLLLWVNVIAALDAPSPVGQQPGDAIVDQEEP